MSRVVEITHLQFCRYESRHVCREALLRTVAQNGALGAASSACKSCPISCTTSSAAGSAPPALSCGRNGRNASCRVASDSFQFGQRHVSCRHGKRSCARFEELKLQQIHDCLEACAFLGCMRCAIPPCRAHVFKPGGTKRAVLQQIFSPGWWT